ncbi:MAG: DUF1624 domain-containing protein [Clostridia bacterium]|nr:DUF1624 domain-containing protein [Clostridia bacterium]
MDEERNNKEIETRPVSRREARKEKRKGRVTELDALRGVAVLLMILDHTAFALWGLLPMAFRDFPASEGFTGKLVDLAKDYWTWGVRIGVRYVILFVFLGLTGVCCSFSRSNLKRGLKLLAAAMVLTLGTFVIGKVTGERDITIVFGVLHCIATALILIGILEKITSCKWVYLCIGVLLTGLGIVLRVHGSPFVSYASGPFPELFGKAFVGLIEIGSDCFAFPLHAGQIFIGVFLGKLLFKDRQPVYRKPSVYRDNFLTFVGRNSLWIYLLHQVLIPLLIGIVLAVCGFHLAL